MTFIDIVFDGPPNMPAPRFVEAEDHEGASINAGEWIDRGDGYWVLRISNLPDRPQPTRIDSIIARWRAEADNMDAMPVAPAHPGRLRRCADELEAACATTGIEIASTTTPANIHFDGGVYSIRVFTPSTNPNVTWPSSQDGDCQIETTTRYDDFEWDGRNNWDEHELRKAALAMLAAADKIKEIQSR